jgi:hypothetical protein
MYKFDIGNDLWYEYDKSRERTRNRLIQMAELGMEEIGHASFGVKDIMSGLYIEMVWSYSDESFEDYLSWVKEMISKKQQNVQV